MYIKEMAKAFKDRNNPEQLGMVIGTVISTNPLKVSIYNGSAILSKENNNLWIGSLLQDPISANINSENGTIKLNILNNGDHVACIPSADGQKFVIFDKVV